MELHRQLFDVVISDVSGCANLAFRMRKTALLEVNFDHKFYAGMLMYALGTLKEKFYFGNLGFFLGANCCHEL